MKKTNSVALIAVFTALYFVLSAMIKIPVVGHITLDLGYIALMVSAVFMGAIPAMCVGGIGALLESALMTQRGISIGWILMNMIVGSLCGLVLYKRNKESKKTLLTASLLIVPAAMLAGVVVKTILDCVIYDLPLPAKIPSGIAAWILDSAVMLAVGLPLSLALRKRIRLTGRKTETVRKEENGEVSSETDRNGEGL